MVTKYCRINPFCSSNGGGSHDSDIDSDVNSSMVRLVGGDVGAEIEAREKHIHDYHRKKKLAITLVLPSSPETTCKGVVKGPCTKVNAATWHS